MQNIVTSLLIITVIVILLPTETYAFGAGDIPDFAYLNDKAFRHGDIENVLVNLAKSAGAVGGGGGLLSLAHSVLSTASGGSKFNKGDVKKVYFGNWLRDYSQAMDIAGLTKLSADTLVLIVSVLGFMTFGFATEEFQVTPDRLSVYLPVEHIDNPKGYAEKEGDARRFHPRLRPPVDPRELEIDERTGMKNYIATEGQSWDTSTAHIRRVFRACIQYGRRARGHEGPDLWEAYRLLGTGLHTLEDLLAHSNWCELALRKMGHEDVFCHVGDRVIIDTPNGPAPPLITGTFGSADFLHSLMGEATDHISQASVTDLSEKMNNAVNSDNSTFDNLKGLLHKLPIGGGSDNQIDQAESLHAQSKAYNFDPNNVAPPEVRQQLWQLLKWRDSIYREILEKIEMVPGLSDLIDELTNALNAYVYTVLAPWLTPILQQATGVLGEGSKAVIDSEDQYEVFDNPHASDPSHSLLSKDHFGLILNEPAGKAAQIVVQNSVNLIVQTWFDDNQDPDRIITQVNDLLLAVFDAHVKLLFGNVTSQILEAFHHPYYATGRSRIQHQMFDCMEQWIGGLGEEAQETLEALTKESVRNGKNKRIGTEDANSTEPGYGSSQGYNSTGGGYSHQQNQYDDRRTTQSYGRNITSSARYEPDSESTLNSNASTYGGSEYSDNHQGTGRYQSQTTGYNSSYEDGRSSHTPRNDEADIYSKRQENNEGGHRYRPHEQPSYGRQAETYGGSEYSDNQQSTGRYQSQTTGYNPSYEAERSSYTSRNDEADTYSRRQDNSEGGHRYRPQEQPSYGRQAETYGGGETYGRSEEPFDRPQDSRRSRQDDSTGYSQYGRENTEGLRSQRNQDDGYSGSGYDMRSGYTRENEGSYEQPREQGYGSGRGQTYGEVEEETPRYGGDGGRSYGGGYERGTGYGESEGGSRRYGGEERDYGGRNQEYAQEERSYGRGGDEYGGGGSAYTGGENRYGEGGEEYREGRAEYGGGRNEYDGSEETFGAERLNINADGEYNDGRRQYGRSEYSEDY